MLEEYLYIDRIRIRSYAEQIGAAMATEKRPQWKVGLSITGPSVEGQQTAAVRAANDHEMISAIVSYLKNDDILLDRRPNSDEEAEKLQNNFVLETMAARRILFRCDPAIAPAGLQQIGVWVSNPIGRPSSVHESEDDRYTAHGMFVYLIEGYWENETFQRAMSMVTALNVVLDGLKSIGVQRTNNVIFSTSRDDFASPTAILERAGGVKGETRNIKTLYRIRAVSDNKVVNVGGRTVRCHDLFGYPIFIAAA